MITGLLAGILIFILHQFQLKSKPVEVKRGFVLRLHYLFGFISITLIAIGLVMPASLLFQSGFDQTDVVICLILFLVFSGAGYWMLVFYKNHQVVYDEARIVVTGMRKEEQSFAWQDIADVKLNVLSSNYIVTLTSGKRIKIYQYLSGVNDFLKRSGKC